MSDDAAKLSPKQDIKKKRSVQFLVDCHLTEACLAEASGDNSSHEVDNVSLKSAGSNSRGRCASPFPDQELEDGSPISVSRPPDAPEDLAVFDIGLGMLTEQTIYQFEFMLPAMGRLSTTEAEVIRSNVVLAEEGKTFQRSADIEVNSIKYMKEDDGESPMPFPHPCHTPSPPN